MTAYSNKPRHPVWHIAGISQTTGITEANLTLFFKPRNDLLLFSIPEKARQIRISG
jgi:hypothetical protein